MLGSLVPRSSGILLHPTSLPGPFGIGDLGREAHQWVDALARARQQWWQVLPVGPTGYGDSPYQSPSTFAGNLNLISPSLLVEDGLASAGDEDGCFLLPTGTVRYSDVIPRKRRLVRQAWDRFQSGGSAELRAEYDHFRGQQSAWLEDYALFVAIKEEHEQRPWWEWPPKLAAQDDRALKQIAEDLAAEIDEHRFGQFLFFRQWSKLREYARGRGIRIIGDLPIYVAEDSADVWANPALFTMGDDHRPKLVAGVPPDYFSETGQLWGNPIYNWAEHARTGYRWWIERVRASLRLVDLIRFDHFRGIEAFWAVPFGSPTAQTGAWLPGPAATLLDAIQNDLGLLPIIAEDLGVITPEVDALRERFGLPGMRILQFAFGGAVESRFLPHRFDRNVVVYTGTHDNDTTAGWAEHLSAEERARLTAYSPCAGREPAQALLRLAWSSVADLAMAPFQDLLALGSSARLNAPGTQTGNWAWRAPEDSLQGEWIGRLKELTETYERAAATSATP
jgi:4-alpha-glucanotransferase